jgi:hypothetical protein
MTSEGRGSIRIRCWDGKLRMGPAVPFVGSKSVAT